MFKVEKDVKMERVPKGPRGKYPFDKMEVGDSFEVGRYDVNKMRSISGSINFYKRREENAHKVFSVAKTPNNKLRVWRTN